jgi:predicted transcriptional regulator
MAQISLRIEKELDDKLQAWCERTGLSKNKALTIAINTFLHSKDAEAMAGMLQGMNFALHHSPEETKEMLKKLK